MASQLDVAVRPLGVGKHPAGANEVSGTQRVVERSYHKADLLIN